MNEIEQIKGYLGDFSEIWGLESGYDMEKDLGYVGSGPGRIEFRTLDEIKKFWCGLQLGCQFGRQDSKTKLEEANLALIKLKIQVQELKNAQP